MLTLISVVLAIALFLYVVLGGADFGAGILEIFYKRRQQKLLAEAIAPVWEANHVWLILVIVILFVGFPPVYATLSLYLHIPLLLALLGIIFRGTAFTFRHYDAQKGPSHRYYAFLFRYSSLLTAFFMGMVLGATILGRVNPAATSFADLFLWPWLNAFSAALGLFTVSLFTLVAAVFLIGEAEPPERSVYGRHAGYALTGSVATGGLVFVTAHLEGLPLVSLFWESPLSLLCLGFSTLLIPLLLMAIRKARIWRSRLIVGSQVGLVLLGWFAVQYPVIIRLQGQANLTLLNSQAPESTLYALLIALLVGVVAVIPAFGYLFWVFKW